MYSRRFALPLLVVLATAVVSLAEDIEPEPFVDKELVIVK
jgi:hypothetical protein